MPNTSALHRWKIFSNVGPCSGQTSPSTNARCFTTADSTDNIFVKQSGSHDFWVHMGSPNAGETVEMPNGSCYKFLGAPGGSGTSIMHYNTNLSLWDTPVTTHTTCDACAAASVALFHEYRHKRSHTTQHSTSGPQPVGTVIWDSGCNPSSSQNLALGNTAQQSTYFYHLINQPNVGDIIQFALGNDTTCFEYLGTNTVSAGSWSNPTSGGFIHTHTFPVGNPNISIPPGVTDSVCCDPCREDAMEGVEFNGNIQTNVWGTLAGTNDPLNPSVGCVPVPSWDCVSGFCSDPGNGQGQYSTWAACDAVCIPPPTPSWDCDCGVCSDPGTGNGQYSSLGACQAACTVNAGNSNITYNHTSTTCSYLLQAVFANGGSCSTAGCPGSCTAGNTCVECFSMVTLGFEYEDPINSNIWFTLPNTTYSFGDLVTPGYDFMSQYSYGINKECTHDLFGGLITNYRLKAEVFHQDSNADYTFYGPPEYVSPPQWNPVVHCGCTDPLAINYLATAQCDDGSCTYLPYHEWLQCVGGNVVNLIQTGDPFTASNTALFLALFAGGGTQIGEAIQLSGDRSCYKYLGTNPNYAAAVISVALTGSIHNDCTACGAVYGCTDPLATNYDPLATIDDGSCTYPPLVCGCTDPAAINGTYDPLATGDCADPCNAIGSTAYTNIGLYGDTSCCDYPVVVYGCADITACNYNPNATNDDGSCCFPGCTDSLALNYNINACCDDGSCLYPDPDIPGCTDPLALNYNPNATIDDGSCLYDGGGANINPNPCTTIDITTITPSPCDLLQIAYIWSNRVSTGTGGCVDELLDDLIMSVALYDMLDETIKNN